MVEGVKRKSKGSWVIDRRVYHPGVALEYSQPVGEPDAWAATPFALRLPPLSDSFDTESTYAMPFSDQENARSQHDPRGFHLDSQNDVDEIIHRLNNMRNEAKLTKLKASKAQKTHKPKKHPLHVDVPLSARGHHQPLDRKQQESPVIKGKKGNRLQPIAGVNPSASCPDPLVGAAYREQVDVRSKSVDGSDIEDEQQLEGFDELEEEAIPEDHPPEKKQASKVKELVGVYGRGHSGRKKAQAAFKPKKATDIHMKSTLSVLSVSDKYLKSFMDELDKRKEEKMLEEKRLRQELRERRREEQRKRLEAEQARQAEQDEELRKIEQQKAAEEELAQMKMQKKEQIRQEQLRKKKMEESLERRSQEDMRKQIEEVRRQAEEEERKQREAEELRLAEEEARLQAEQAEAERKAREEEEERERQRQLELELARQAAEEAEKQRKEQEERARREAEEEAERLRQQRLHEEAEAKKRDEEREEQLRREAEAKRIEEEEKEEERLANLQKENAKREEKLRWQAEVRKTAIKRAEQRRRTLLAMGVDVQALDDKYAAKNKPRLSIISSASTKPILLAHPPAELNSSIDLQS